MQAQLIKTVSAYRAYAKGGRSARRRDAAARAGGVTLRVLERRLVAPARSRPPASGLLLQLTGDGWRSRSRTRSRSSRRSRRGMRCFSSRPGRRVLISRARSRAVKPPVAHKIRGTHKQVQQAQAAFTAAASKAAGQQADAVEAYDGKIAGLERRLRTLDPPPIVTARLSNAAENARSLEHRRLGARAGASKKDRSHVAVFGRHFTLGRAHRRQRQRPKGANCRNQRIQPSRARHRHVAGRHQAGARAGPTRNGLTAAGRE